MRMREVFVPIGGVEEKSVNVTSKTPPVCISGRVIRKGVFVPFSALQKHLKSERTSNPPVVEEVFIDEELVVDAGCGDVVTETEASTPASLPRTGMAAICKNCVFYSQGKCVVGEPTPVSPEKEACFAFETK